MKPVLSDPLVAGWLLGTFCFVAGNVRSAEAIQSVRLDRHAVCTVPVATNRVTTLTFPGPISAIDAAGVVLDPEQEGGFLLGHTKGASFLSVRALQARATGNLNVRWNRHTYVFELVQSDAPVLSLLLDDAASSRTVLQAPVFSPVRLLSFLDKAKAFPLLKEQHPDAVADVAFRTWTAKPSVTDYDDFSVNLEEAFRFNDEDTLLFRLAITNRTDGAIAYRPDSFALRAGDRLYPQSISDASGLLPARSESTVYFAVTGTPDGGRNELSLDNDFSVFVERLPVNPVARTEPAESCIPANTPSTGEPSPEAAP